MVLNRKQDERAVVFTLASDSPGMEEIVRHVFDRLALQRLNGNEGQLGACGLLDSGGIACQFGSARGIHHAGEIAHVALRLQSFPVDRERRRKQA